MNNRTFDSRFIIAKWDKEKYLIAQIAGMDIPCCASLKRISNIVYRGRGKGKEKHKNDFEKRVYNLFRMKFLELQNIPATIAWVHENQPTVRVCERTVYRVICHYIKRLKI